VPLIKTLILREERTAAAQQAAEKSVWQHLQKGPGLKPIEFTGIFAGLKPCAPTEKHRACIFRSL